MLQPTWPVLKGKHAKDGQPCCHGGIKDTGCVALVAGGGGHSLRGGWWMAQAVQSQGRTTREGQLAPAMNNGWSLTTKCVPSSETRTKKRCVLLADFLRPIPCCLKVQAPLQFYRLMSCMCASEMRSDGAPRWVF